MFQRNKETRGANNRRFILVKKFQYMIVYQFAMSRNLNLSATFKL